jgi:hypothetical protein
MGSLIDPFVPQGDLWIEELFETTSFIPLLHSSARNVIRMMQPALDLVFAAPIALLIVVTGFSRGSRPYLLVGLGLLLFMPEDIFSHFQLLSLLEIHGQLSNLLTIMSQLYILNGVLLNSFGREEEAAAPA